MFGILNEPITLTYKDHDETNKSLIYCKNCMTSMDFNAYYNAWGQDQLSLPFTGKQASRHTEKRVQGWHQTVLISKQGLYLVPYYFTGKYSSYINQRVEKLSLFFFFFFTFLIPRALHCVDIHINAKHIYFFTFAIVVC